MHGIGTALTIRLGGLGCFSAYSISDNWSLCVRDETGQAHLSQIQLKIDGITSLYLLAAA